MPAEAGIQGDGLPSLGLDPRFRGDNREGKP